MAELAAVFGGAAPHSLSEYYAAAAGVPASGAISLSQFIGKSGSTQKTFNVTCEETKYFFGYSHADGGIAQGSINTRSLNGRTVSRVGYGFSAFTVAFNGNFTTPPFDRLWIEGAIWFDVSNFTRSYNSTYDSSVWQIGDLSGDTPLTPYLNALSVWKSGTRQIIAEYN